MHKQIVDLFYFPHMLLLLLLWVLLFYSIRDSFHIHTKDVVLNEDGNASHENDNRQHDKSSEQFAQVS